MDAETPTKPPLAQRVKGRIKYPWPIYRKAGALRAVVHRADGTVEDRGVVAYAYAKRWRASSEE